ncbi:MAG: 5-formyltetrahydrofolate cyclo-ligase [Akkermansia sp.]|nr:5-formyltetrahydrofolate cyclo-ligase [Akkermansia sp.]
MQTKDNKRSLRRVMLERLRSVPTELRNEQSAQLCRALAPFLNKGQKSLTVAIYAPMAHEVNLLLLLNMYPQHHFAVPRCREARRMDFYHITRPEEQIQPDSRNIPAPIEGLTYIPPQQFDIIIVPGVAFTAQGARLGYGGGYYDTYLPQCPQATLIAAAFPGQILESIPTEAHDLTIPHIITPSNFRQ